MRPKLLEIEGLQSFQRNQKIDFDTLGETGLFGIFGPTGSGKSTVLDAITLALYGKVKRAERGTQGIINANMDNARAAFTFELSQSSTRKTYRVERNFQRKKGTENSCEPKVVRLIEITPAGDIPLCDKTTEVTNSIEALLGLNHDDFTRAVVLPQNSFQEFLFLDNAKKREMLERIFYLEEYGRQLQDKLSRKISCMKSRLDVLSGELKGYADATDEALEQTQKEMEFAIAERKRIEKEYQLLEVRYNEGREVWQFIQELSFVKQREEQHAANQDVLNEKRILLEKAVKADGLLDKIQKNRELENKLHNTQQQLNDVLQVIPGVEQNLKQIRQQNETLKIEASVEQPRLISLKTRLADALAIQTNITVINRKLQTLQNKGVNLAREIAANKEQYTSGKSELDKLLQTIGQLHKDIALVQVSPEYREQIQNGLLLENQVQAHERNKVELDRKIAVSNATLAQLNQKLNQIREKISQEQKALDTLTHDKEKHTSQMPDDKTTLILYKDQISAVKNVLDILNIRKAVLDKAESTIIRIDQALSNAVAKAKEMEELRDGYKTTCDNAAIEVQKAVSALERNAAYSLSKSLKEGEPCPVCGSWNHPSPTAHTGSGNITELEKTVEDAKKQLAEYEEAFREADRNTHVANERINSWMHQKEQAQADRDAKFAQVQSEREKLDGQFKNLGLEQIQQQLDSMSALYLSKLQAAEAWEKKLNDYDAEIKQTTDQLNKEKMLENGYLAELSVNGETLKQHREDLEIVEAELESKQQAYQQFLQQHHIESASAERKRITNNDKKSEVLQKKLEQEQAFSEKKRAELERLKDLIQQMNDNDVKTQAEADNLNIQKTDMEAKVRELAGDAGIEEQIKQADHQLEQYRQLETQYANLLQSTEQQYNTLVAKRSTLQNQMDIFTEQFGQEEQTLAATLNEKGFKSPEEVEQSYIPMEKQISIKKEIDEFDQKTINLKAEREIVQKKLKSRTMTEEEWNLLDSQYQEVSAWKEACVTRSEVARTSFDNTKVKHDKWVALTQSHTELSNKHGLVTQIQKLLKAERSRDNSFIDYIAEERLRYVAAEASDILGVMTKYKYALELDTNAGFIIRDNANGGAHRMVTSLSGGETFLTALSLALALSEQIQLKGQSPLEFFFLDEGFGTLDNNLLDAVIDSLERLSKKERVIGIISHVPELRNRMSRRLIVTPPTAQGEGSQVQIDKA